MEKIKKKTMKLRIKKQKILANILLLKPKN